jgi:hypothetical protein
MTGRLRGAKGFRRSAQDRDRRKILICIVEATPGIEPGYTVLQSRQGTLMWVDENHCALI